MIYGKYLNKYHLKYGIFMALGILFLCAVDICQLFIPDLIGKLVELFTENYDPNSVMQQVQRYGLQAHSPFPRRTWSSNPFRSRQFFRP